MCNCLKESEKRVSDFVIEKNNLTNVTEFGYANTAITFSTEDAGTKLFLPFEVTYIPKKKDGTDAKKKVYKTSIFPQFCPFCGNKNK